MRECDLKNLKLRYITLRNKNGEIRQNYYFFAELAEGAKIEKECNERILEWVSVNEVCQAAKGRPLEDSGGLYDGKVFYFTIGERSYRKREKRMKTYKELYQAGEIEFEAIDDYSYEWGMSEDERTLAQYLGLNAEEEDAWVSIGEDALRELLDKGKKRY